MRELISKAFIIFISIFLFYIFITNDDWIDFIYVNNFIFFLILVTVFVAVVWTGIRLDKWMNSLRLALIIQLVISFFIILFFTYQVFTPYFYTSNHLEKVGLENIRSYYQLSNNGISDKEREKLAESSLSETMAFSTINQEHFPEGNLVGLETIGFSQSYYLYYLTVEVKQLVGDNTEQSTYRFTFNKEDGDFKIDGFVQLK